MRIRTSTSRWWLRASRWSITFSSNSRLKNSTRPIKSTTPTLRRVCCRSLHLQGLRLTMWLQSWGRGILSREDCWEVREWVSLADHITYSRVSKFTFSYCIGMIYDKIIDQQQPLFLGLFASFEFSFILSCFCGPFTGDSDCLTLGAVFWDFSLMGTELKLSSGVAMAFCLR